MDERSKTNLSGNAMVFPFHMCNISQYKRLWLSLSNTGACFTNSFKVHAAVVDTVSQKPKDISSTSTSQDLQQTHLVSEKNISPTPGTSSQLEALAKAYIQQETGKERIRMMFKKDHIGRSSPEMEYIQVALVQTFVISFFMKYVPEFRLARQDFIREHHGTVFRTRLEASRKLQDHVSLRAASAGGKFAFKMTAFGASFLFLSQIIASYRNKTSVLEYAAAAGITGGLARLQLGVKGFLAGSLLGCFLGSLVGCLAYGTFKAYDATQEQRHLSNIIALLEVQKSIEGETEFKKKIEDLKSRHLDQPLPAS